MRNNRGIVSIAPILAISGLVALGATGYRMISGNCPFSCDGGASSCALPVAATAAGADDCSGCCDSMKATPAATTVSLTAPASPCCSESAETTVKAEAQPAAPIPSGQ